MNKQEYKLIPIGYVEAKQGQFRLKIKKGFISGLDGLSSFGHVSVFWWAHEMDNDEDRKILDCTKPYRKAPEKLGIFATRSPARPNPLALTTAAILDVDLAEGIIQIPFIDAKDGTPIIDLKPYQPTLDRIKEVRMPDWCDHWPKWMEESAQFDWESEFTFEV